MNQEMDISLEDLDMSELSKALDNIGDETMDKLFKLTLTQCYEVLPAGATQVLNKDGTFGVPNIEYDLVLMIQLTLESILWSISPSFTGSRWTSMFQSLAATLPQKPKTLKK